MPWPEMLLLEKGLCFGSLLKLISEKCLKITEEWLAFIDSDSDLTRETRNGDFHTFWSGLPRIKRHGLTGVTAIFTPNGQTRSYIERC